MILALLLLIALAPADEHAVALAAEAALVDAWPDAASGATVEVVQLSPGVREAEGELRVRFPREARPEGRVGTDVDVRRPDGGWERAGWAYLSVRWSAAALVPVRDIARGETITVTDVRRERLPRTEIPGRPLALDVIEAGEWTARRPLRAGAPLTTRDVERPPVVSLGESVRVLYVRGGLRFWLDGEARGPGAPGDLIDVYCSTTRATYRVRLLGPGEGEWVSTH